MPLRVLTAMMMFGLAAAAADEAVERKSAPPTVCFQPLDEREAPRCALPPAATERAS